MMALALMLLVGAGAAHAQDCCKQEGQNEKKACCQKNAAIENIMTRTSIRKFKDQPVEAEKVETMLRAAMAAPTAMNRQPWHFVVVSDKQVLGELAGQGRRGDMLRNAPLAIIVCGDFTKTGEGKGQEFWIQDTSAATENLLLAAHALGLGAVWTAAWPMDERYKNIQKVLSMPETIVPLCTVIIGYADEEPTPKDKWKPENVSYNKYGTAK
ncbi:MAG: nitroreductase family protein [Prevotella sp.]|nr:nitroreductase family protein [Prevotella sp.]